jgi:hypothetical protein
MNRHIVSLETSKELVKVLPGFESQYVWVDEKLYGKAKDGTFLDLELGGMKCVPLPPCDIYPALFLTEVLELLPEGIKNKGTGLESRLEVTKNGAYYVNGYGAEAAWEVTKDDNLPTAAARLAIWLVENGYELNKIKNS